MYTQALFLGLVSLAIFFFVYSTQTQNPIVWQMLAWAFLAWAFVSWISILVQRSQVEKLF